ncbi:MAG TPA: pilin [Candidatus Andersenbacteria bacterium]|nr:pilin [Candidatus Andersenbacteria bacterium]
MNKKIFSQVYAFVIVVLLPIITHAQLVKCGPTNQGYNLEPCTIDDFFGLFVTIFNWLLGMSAIVAFIFLIYGGIRMFLYSVDEEHLAAGKKTVIEAVIGLAIILLAYVLVNTLMVAIGVKNPSDYFSGKAQSQQ